MIVPIFEWILLLQHLKQITLDAANISLDMYNTILPTGLTIIADVLLNVFQSSSNQPLVGNVHLYNV